MKLAPGPPGEGREFLADLRRSGWPDPVELWNKYAADSGVRIIEENIVEASVFAESPSYTIGESYVKNKLRIKTELFTDSSQFIFVMTFRIKYSSIVASDRPDRGGAWLDDVEVGEFELHSDTFSGVFTRSVSKMYEDKNWYPAVDPKPISVFATIPSITTPFTSPAHEEFKMTHFEWKETDDWRPPTQEEIDGLHMPTIPDAPGRGRSLREDIARVNAEREMRKKLAASRPKCAPMLDSNNRVTCACRTNAPDLFWCESSNFYVKNPATLNTLSHRVSPGGFPDHDGMDGYLPWTHGYLDLPVFYGRVTYEGDTLNGRVNVSERHSGLSIEIASGRGESLQTASDMYLSYYKATMDMLFIGDAIKDIQREIGSLDRLSAYTKVPFKQCPNRRHMVSEDRLMAIKILSALESGTLPEDIILSEAWSITFNGKCTVCMENKFVVPPEDLM